MDDPIRVLHVDDEADLTELAATFLERAEDRFQIETAANPAEGLDVLGGGEFDCVVSDQDMPGQTGVEFLSTVRERWPDLPFILFTGKGSEEVASKAISAGATEYLQKEVGTEQYELLANRIVNAVEKRRAQRAVQQRERRFHALLEHSPDRLSIVDPDGHYKFVSPAMKGLMGHDPEEMLGESGFEYVHPSDRADLRSVFDQVLEDPDGIQTAVYRYRNANGTYRWVESKLSDRLDDPAIEGIILNSRDVSEHKADERKLRTERTFITQALDALGELFYVVGTDGELRRWNDRLTEVTGYSDEEVQKMTAEQFFAEDHRQRVADAVEATREDGDAIVEADVLTADGERIPYELTGARLTGPDGKVMGLAGVGRAKSCTQTGE